MAAGESINSFIARLAADMKAKIAAIEAANLSKAQEAQALASAKAVQEAAIQQYAAATGKPPGEVADAVGKANGMSSTTKILIGVGIAGAVAAFFMVKR